MVTGRVGFSAQSIWGRGAGFVGFFRHSRFVMARHARFHKERCGPKSYPSRIYYSPQNLFKPGAKKDLPGISRKAGSETMNSRMYGNFPLRIERQGTLFRQFIRRRATGENAFWHSRNFSVRPRPRRRRRTAPTPPRGGTSVCSGPLSHLQISRPEKMRKARVPSPSLSFHQGFISSRSLLLRA